MSLNLGEQKQSPPWLGWSFTWKAGWEKSSSFQNDGPLLGFCPMMGSLSKTRLVHTQMQSQGSPTPMTLSLNTNTHCLARVFFFFKGWGNVSSLMKIGYGPTGPPAVRTTLIASLIFCFEGVQGVLAGQKVGNLLWGQRTCSLSCVNRSRSGSDFKAWFPSDGGER